MINKLKIGDEVHCNYQGDYEFDGVVRDFGCGTYLVKVHLGTGHKQEDSLHSNGCWYVKRSDTHIRIQEYQYDQTGDTEDDI